MDRDIDKNTWHFYQHFYIFWDLNVIPWNVITGVQIKEKLILCRGI